MNRNTKDDMVLTWSEIAKFVIWPFNLTDFGMSHAVLIMRNHIERVRAFFNAGKDAHNFTSMTVPVSIVDFFQPDVKGGMVASQVTLAHDRRFLKLINVSVVLGEIQILFVNQEIAERIVSELLAVLRVTKSLRTIRLQEVIQVSITFAHNKSNKNAELPSWLSGLLNGVQDFANALTECISTYGAGRCEKVNPLCQDASIAKTVSNDVEISPCKKSLAQTRPVRRV